MERYEQRVGSVMPQNRVNQVVNGGVHEHTPITVDGQRMCSTCHEIIITPLLTQEQFAAANGQPAELWFDAVKSLCPKPLDFMLIELCERLGWEWPNYVEQLSEYYGGENPPHTERGPYAWE